MKALGWLVAELRLMSKRENFEYINSSMYSPPFFPVVEASNRRVPTKATVRVGCYAGERGRRPWEGRASIFFSGAARGNFFFPTAEFLGGGGRHGIFVVCALDRRRIGT